MKLTRHCNIVPPHRIDIICTLDDVYVHVFIFSINMFVAACSVVSIQNKKVEGGFWLIEWI